MTTELTESKRKRDETSVWIRFLVMAVVTILAVGGVCIFYTNRSVQQAERRQGDDLRRFCGLLITLDDSYRDVPPTTPTGIKVATELHDLRVAYGC